jgi:N-glycosylase/DNA lyase
MPSSRREAGGIAPSRLPLSLEVRDFDLGLTLECGQVFHAFGGGSHWEVLAGSHLLEVAQEGEVLTILRGDPEIVFFYFGLDHPMQEIYATFPTDVYATEALRLGRGMRIIRQPPWECLATFITSSLKRVPHIRAMSLALRDAFGTPVRGSQVNAYPDPSRLAASDEARLRACGLGFRARHLLAAARLIAGGGVDLDALRTLPSDALRSKLCEIPGVGRKVANCVMLFAYERLDAVPVDVWVARIAVALRRRRGGLEVLERYAVKRFGPFAGYVQQYLFHRARTTGTLPEP